MTRIFLKYFLVICLGVGGNLTPATGQILQEEELSNRLDSLVQLAIEGGEVDSGQIIDIFQALLDNGMVTDSLVARVWNVATSFLRAGQYQFAENTANWALDRVSYKAFPEQLVKLLLLKTDLYANTIENDEVSNVIAQAKSVVERHKLDSYVPVIAIVEGTMAMNKGAHYEALEIGSDIEANYLQEMSLDDIVAFHMLMGNIFRELGEDNRALTYFKEGYELAKKSEIKKWLLSSFENNLAIVYSKVDSFGQSEFFHQRNLEVCKKNGNLMNQAMAYMNLGTLRSRQGDHPRAILYFDSSLAISQKMQIPVGIAIGNINKGRSLMKLGKKEQAQQALKKARAVLDQIDSPALERSWSVLASSNNYDLGFSEEAYTILKKAYDDREAEREAEVEELVASWENQLKASQAEKKAIEIENALKIQQSRMSLLIALGAILILIIVIGAIYIRKIRQKEELLAQLVEQEKEKNHLEMELKNRELASKSLDIQKALGLREIMVRRLKQIEGDDVDILMDQIKELTSDIQNTLPEALWEDFKQRFENVERDFIPKLLEVCPELSPIELKTATFLRLNLTSKEIASLTNRAQGTVNNNRSALRKKLNIDSDENLMVFLLGL